MPSSSTRPTDMESSPKETPLKNRLLSIPGPSWLWTHAQPLAQPLTYPIRAYSRAQNRYPYVVQIFSSLAIYFLGDLSSQYIQGSTPGPPSEQHTFSSSQSNSGLPNSIDPAGPSDGVEADRFHYDPERSKRALIIGGLFSLPSYHWFLFLSRNFNLSTTMPYSTGLSLAIKIIVNQIIFTPFFNSYFFGMQSLLSGRSLSTGSNADTNQETRETTFFDLEGRFGAAWERVKETVPISWYNSCKFWPFVTAFSFTFVRPQSRSVFAGVVAIGWQSYLGLVNQRAAERAKSSEGVR